jgi:hypothetical protein
MKTAVPAVIAGFVFSLCAWGADNNNAAVPAPAAGVREARAAVQRSLPYIEKTSKAWMVEKKCSSCHVVSFDAWSHTSAAVRGLDVDREKSMESVKWALADCLSDRHWFGVHARQLSDMKTAGLPDAMLTKLKTLGAKNFTKEPDFLTALEKALGKEDLDKHKESLFRLAKLPNNGGGPDTLAQILLGLAPLSEDKALKDSYLAIRSLLLEWQEPDGSWLAQGQVPSMKWDGEKEMNDATTMWSLLAVSACDTVEDSLVRSRQRALEYLKTSVPGKTVQTLALHLIVAHKFGEPSRADGFRSELLARQNEDGGWSWWKDNKTSDAFATGQALYALGTTGRDGRDAAVAKAWKFLGRTQAEDGTWNVPQEVINTHPRKLNVYTYWGAAWAAIGILQTLPAKGDLPAGANTSVK